MDVREQTILVTGGASGLGYATAMRLKQAGAKVAICDLPGDRLDQAVKTLDVLGVGCDVTSEESTIIALAKINQELGDIRGCVNCAGIIQTAKMVGRSGPLSLEAFEKVIRINLMGTFNIMRLCAAEMMKLEPLSLDGEQGVMINTASVAAFEGQIGQVGYSASKGGVAAMTLPVAREMAAFGIRVMAIAPGVIETPMLGELSDEAQTSLAEQIPFPKRLGKADEFAALVQHIFENSYLNGSVIRLDGALRLAAR